MKNRNNLFILLVVICVIAPGIHYFIGGRNYDHGTVRNALVGAQILGGIALLLFFGKSRSEDKEGKASG